MRPPDTQPSVPSQFGTDDLLQRIRALEDALQASPTGRGLLAGALVLPFNTVDPTTGIPRSPTPEKNGQDGLAKLWITGSALNLSVYSTALGWKTISATSAAGGTPAVVLGTAGAAGVSGTFLRDDDTIAAFDTGVPVTQAFSDAAATGSQAFAARRDHVHGMPAHAASTLTGASLAVGVTASSLTSLGTLTSLTMGGTLTMGANTLALAGATVSGTPTWAAAQALTVSTAAQPNITSLGTLTGLNVTVSSGDIGLLFSTQAANDSAIRLRTNQANSSIGVIFDNSSATNAIGGVRLAGTILSFVVGGTSGQGLYTSNEKATLDSTGIFTTKNKLYPGTDAAATQAVTGIFAGNGVPANANGTNGDFYFRGDGAAGTFIYHRAAGAWAAFA